jgi:hypothetical protein
MRYGLAQLATFLGDTLRISEFYGRFLKWGKESVKSQVKFGVEYILSGG